MLTLSVQILFSSAQVRYDIFISHHKGGAGNTARLMKCFLLLILSVHVLILSVHILILSIQARLMKHFLSSGSSRVSIFFDADNL